MKNEAAYYLTKRFYEKTDCDEYYRTEEYDDIFCLKKDKTVYFDLLTEAMTVKCDAFFTARRGATHSLTVCLLP